MSTKNMSSAAAVGDPLRRGEQAVARGSLTTNEPDYLSSATKRLGSLLLAYPILTALGFLLIVGHEAAASSAVRTAAVVGLGLVLAVAVALVAAAHTWAVKR